ncbi:MAG: phosphoribosylamine---glycine ligase [Thermoleophilaceae bacterium]|nr:phosphoribosylamine---glycine ligase [Thermoleophilaceae bacterium]
MNPRVLVVGGGGREHALVRALRRSPQQPEVLAAPGNVGIARDGVETLPIEVTDLPAITAAARERSVDLVVVGPEAPLVAGLVDMLGEAGIRAFGPSAAAAKIEGSKAYAKKVMKELGVPTASYMVFRTREEALAQLPCASYPAVLKADVLAAGKGVIVCSTEQEAREAVDVFFGERRFGATTVVLEEFLEGEEVSLLALCDGVRALPMAPAQDYKRIFDDDEGPNTGGMGSYSPVPGYDADWAMETAAVVHQPIVDDLRARGTPFHGVLYAGLMITSSGPKVLEYNARFGDPETQAILPRLRSDPLELLDRAARPGGLEDAEIEWSRDWAVTLVLASRGYPESASKGDAISGLDALGDDVEVLHAGTAERDGEVVTAGGRVLNVTAMGPTAAEARERAYAAADRIDFNGKQLRRDIAARAVERVEA